MISIIICTYNRVEKLKLVIEDILSNQSDVSIDYELLVVDNNSHDSTKKLLDNYTEHFPQKVRYIFEGKQGLCNARNCGIKKARGEWICFTDDDVRIHPEWLKNLNDSIQMLPDMSAYGGRILPNWVEDPPEWFIREGPFAMNGGAIVSRDLGEEVSRMNELNVTPIGANMGFKKEVFDKVGYFNPDFGKKGNDQSLGDDVEFCNRVKYAGFEMYYLPTPIIYHDVDNERLQVPMVKEFYFRLGYSRGKQGMFPARSKWLLGAPRYLFRDLVTYFLKSVVYRFINLSKSLFYQFQFYYVRGLLKGCYESK